MDALALFALATDPPNQDLFTVRHNENETSMVSDKMYKHIIGQVILHVTILVIFLFAGENFLLEFEDDFDSKYITPQNYLLKYNDPA